VGSLTLNDSTVSGNKASFGGGIYNGLTKEVVTGRHPGSLTLNGSSWVTENTASKQGGGIYNNETLGSTITFGLGWSGAVSGNTPHDIFNA
jgi:hypothetical protein